MSNFQLQLLVVLDTPADPQKVRAGDLELSLESYEVTRGGEPIQMLADLDISWQQAMLWRRYARVGRARRGKSCHISQSLSRASYVLRLAQRNDPGSSRPLGRRSGECEVVLVTLH